jgi:hypothetical protein
VSGALGLGLLTTIPGRGWEHGDRIVVAIVIASVRTTNWRNLANHNTDQVRPSLQGDD